LLLLGLNRADEGLRANDRSLILSRRGGPGFVSERGSCAPSPVSGVLPAVGFDFLGYTIRQFQVGKTHTGKSTHGKPLGFKTIIKPSKEAIKRHTRQIGQVFRKQRNAPQERGIRDLNPIIRGWCLYHCWVICSETFNL